MKLVIDANIVISAIILIEGKTRDLIFSDDIFLIAPEFLLEEVKKYKMEIMAKSGLSDEEFELTMDLLFSKIKLIPFSSFKKFINQSKIICPDPNDIQYFALALCENTSIWPDDEHFQRQDKMKVLKTKDMMNLR